MSGAKPTKNSIGRTVLICICVLMQIGWLIYMLIQLNEHYAAIAAITSTLSLIVVLNIYGTERNSAFKITWFFTIFLFPLMGLVLYALSGYSFGRRHIQKRFEKSSRRRLEAIGRDTAAAEALRRDNLKVARQSEYIAGPGSYPVYRGGSIRYFPLAVEGLQAQKEALRSAEKFIFMEYFAIEDSLAFSEVKQILAEKAAQGVEVRLLYDDAGSIGYVNGAFTRQMQSLGIKCQVFNPILPFLNIFMNHRDHRKITVVDGKLGFTGGYNMADEYFNYTSPYGFWKDTGVMIEGDAVRNLTAMFLEMWDAMTNSESDYTAYMQPCKIKTGGEDCYIQPYADSPLDDERVGENVYLNMIKGAVNYVHIVTPYLILDEETASELILAAKRGVEVSILTPGIPDKKLVFMTTRSYYAQLIKNGVHIYEYTPGFPHAKMVVCDDEVAVVGTINLDYRSLYLHFEDAVFMYGCKVVKEIDEDIRNALTQSRDVTDEYAHRKVGLRIWQSLLRLFAPLM